jgi:hypothetical protein
MKNFALIVTSLIFLLPLSPATFAQDEENALDYLPPSQFIPGWEKSDNEYFSHANGAGFMLGDILPLLYEYDLVWYATDTYFKGADEMRIEIFEFPSASDAFGFYSVSYISEPDPADIYVEKPYDMPPASTLDTIRRISGPEHDILEGYQDRFYFRIDTTEELLDVSGIRAGTYLIASLPGQADPAAMIGILPATNRVHGTERYIRGPVGLNQLIDIGGEDILGFNEFDYKAVAAMYRLGGGEYYLEIIAEYEDAEIAGTALNELAGWFSNRDWDTVMVAPLESGIHPRAFSGEFTVAMWSEGPRLTLLWDLSDMETLGNALNQAE